MTYIKINYYQESPYIIFHKIKIQIKSKKTLHLTYRKVRISGIPIRHGHNGHGEIHSQGIGHRQAEEHQDALQMTYTKTRTCKCAIYHVFTYANRPKQRAQGRRTHPCSRSADSHCDCSRKGSRAPCRRCGCSCRCSLIHVANLDAVLDELVKWGRAD